MTIKLCLCFFRRVAKYWVTIFVMSMPICLCVCLSARKPRGRTSPFLCMLPVAVARSSSDGVVIRYVLPVLWMASCFHTISQWAEIYLGLRVEAFPILGLYHCNYFTVITTVFGWVRQNLALGWSLLSVISLFHSATVIIASVVDVCCIDDALQSRSYFVDRP